MILNGEASGNPSLQHLRPVPELLQPSGSFVSPDETKIYNINKHRPEEFMLTIVSFLSFHCK